MSYLALYIDWEETAKYTKDLGQHKDIKEAKQACNQHAQVWFRPDEQATVEIIWKHEVGDEIEGVPKVSLTSGSMSVVYSDDKYKILLNTKRNRTLVKDMTRESIA